VAEGAAHLCEDIAAAKGIVEDEVRRFAVRKRSERLARSSELFGSGGKRSEPRSFPGSAPAPGTRRPSGSPSRPRPRHIVAKLHRDPIVRLKELSSPGNDATNARVLEELFGIEQRPK
jgi:glutamyl-tRNA reductase